MVFMLSPTILSLSANTRIGKFHLVSILPDFLGPSCWHILKQSWNPMAKEYLHISDRFEKKMYR
jgi:hypothetical protein